MTLRQAQGERFGVKAAKGPDHYLAFNHAWFREHQALLLWALNTPILGRAIRIALRLDMSDVWMPRGTKIQAIGPNYYTVRLSDGQLRSDFRTHWKYSKRLYYAWKPIWWTMHAWDAAFADAWAPRLAFGFSTLEVYPDPDPETTTVDGRMARFNVTETWATIIAGAGGFSEGGVVSDDGVSITASGTADRWRFLFRSIFLFNTSALGSGASITAAVLSLKGSAKTDALSATPDIDIYTSSPASNTAIVNGDFSQVGSVSQTGSPSTYAGWSVSDYNAFTFDATGRGNISLTGVSKFGARNANYDVAGSTPPYVQDAQSAFRLTFADQTGTASDPKLVVTYSAAASPEGSGVAAKLMAAGVM